MGAFSSNAFALAGRVLASAANKFFVKRNVGYAKKEPEKSLRKERLEKFFDEGLFDMSDILAKLF